MNLIRATSKITIAKTVSAVLNFVGIIIFTRLLSPSMMGTYFLFIALVNMFAVFSDVGVRGSVEKRISQGMDSGEVLISALCIKLPVLLLVSIVAYHFSSFISEYLGGDLIVPLIIIFILYDISHLQIKRIKANLRVGETAILYVTHKIIWVVFGMVFIKYGLGVRGLIYAYGLGIIIQLLLGIMKLSLVYTHPTINTIISILNYAKHNFLTSVGRYSFDWFDVLIIGWFVSNTAVAIYEIAWRVSGLMILISTAISTVIFPQISKWHSKGQIQRANNLISLSMIWGVILIIPAVFGASVVGEDMLKILFGDEYGAGWLALIVLLISRIPQSIYMIGERCLQAINRPDLSAFITVFLFLLNCILNIAFIYAFGMLGAALATAMAFALSSVFTLHHINQEFKITYRLKIISYCIISSCLMMVSIYLIYQYMDVLNSFSLILIISTGVAIFVISMKMFSDVRELVRETINMGVVE